MYINFDEYVGLGGTVEDEILFKRLRTVAERKLDYYTQNRCREGDWILEAVDALASIIDLLAKGAPLEAFHAEGLTMNYAGAEPLEQQIWRIIREVMPDEALGLAADRRTE